uniref:Uncharacterized protein n=2 Tax=Oryza sativa subsp. japonica TaxID=39947 RepID=Q53LU5_ORYSJ|nr:hypothetical protein LOC_Os11g16270 [Oryza sativa Japonica Group]ABA92482.1 hypothetical protein LOC_Os11g16269 [Oryza sativa Japonica Group]
MAAEGREEGKGIGGSLKFVPLPMKVKPFDCALPPVPKEIE